MRKFFFLFFVIVGLLPICPSYGDSNELIINSIDCKNFPMIYLNSVVKDSNEHGNGMIRRYLPKGTNFDNLTQEELQQIVNLINNRPRKILGYKTAREIFTKEIQLLSKEK